MKENTEKSIQYSFPTNSCCMENLFTIFLEVKSRLSYNHKVDTRQTSRKLKWISFIRRKLASPHIKRGKLFVHQDKIHSRVCGQRSFALFCYLQFTEKWRIQRFRDLIESENLRRVADHVEFSSKATCQLFNTCQGLSQVFPSETTEYKISEFISPIMF